MSSFVQKCRNFPTGVVNFVENRFRVGRQLRDLCTTMGWISSLMRGNFLCSVAEHVCKQLVCPFVWYTLIKYCPPIAAIRKFDKYMQTTRCEFIWGVNFYVYYFAGRALSGGNTDARKNITLEITRFNKAMQFCCWV